MQQDKTKNIRVIIALSILIILYSLFRSTASKITFIDAFDQVTSLILIEAWKFISTPTIFLGVLAFILIWSFRKSIESVFPGLKEFKAGSFSALFDTPAIQVITQTRSDISGAEFINEQEMQDEIIAERFITSLEITTCHFLLGLDNKQFTVFEVSTKMMNEAEVLKNTANLLMNEDEQLVFYAGVFRTLYDYVLPALFIINVSDNEKLAQFTLKAGVREKLEKRMDQLKGEPSASIKKVDKNNIKKLKQKS
jgi:hypothetical protein